jgi:hypothetical protein
LLRIHQEECDKTVPIGVLAPYGALYAHVRMLSVKRSV